MSTIWIDQVLRPLYDYEVSYLSSIQKTFQDSEQLLINVSVWGDPSKAFYIVFPILLAIHQTTGKQNQGNEFYILGYKNQLIQMAKY